MMHGYYAMGPWMGAAVTPGVPAPAPLPQGSVSVQQPSPGNDRGQYGRSLDPAPWTDAQRQAFQSSLAVGTIGSVAGAIAWKEHRVWGFILGGMAGGALGRLVFRPPTDFAWQRGRMMG